MKDATPPSPPSLRESGLHRLGARIDSLANTSLLLKHAVLICILSIVASFAALSRFSLPANVDDTVRTFGISDLVTQLKHELIDMEIDRRSTGEDAAFQINAFDLEISFVVKNSSKRKGEIEYRVVTVGGETEAARERTHKITLHMGMVEPEAIVVSSSPRPIDNPKKPIVFPTK